MAGNVENLRHFTSETAKAAGSIGGKASGASRRRKANLRKAANDILANLMVTVDDVEMTAEEGVILTMLNKALDGDVNAYKALMATVGVAGQSELDEKEQKARIKKMEVEAKALAERLKVASELTGEDARVVILDDIAVSIVGKEGGTDGD